MPDRCYDAQFACSLSIPSSSGFAAIMLEAIMLSSCP